MLSPMINFGKGVYKHYIDPDPMINFGKEVFKCDHNFGRHMGTYKPC